jgi:hypothetical protein
MLMRKLKEVVEPVEEGMRVKEVEEQNCFGPAWVEEEEVVAGVVVEVVDYR